MTPHASPGRVGFTREQTDEQRRPLRVPRPSTVRRPWQDGSAKHGDAGLGRDSWRQSDHDCKLTLQCGLLIDDVEVCRELTIVSVSGDALAVEDARKYFDRRNGQNIANDSYEDERMFDVAEGLSKALMLQDATAGIDTLVVKVLP